MNLQGIIRQFNGDMYVELGDGDYPLDRTQWDVMLPFIGHSMPLVSVSGRFDETVDNPPLIEGRYLKVAMPTPGIPYPNYMTWDEVVQQYLDETGNAFPLHLRIWLRENFHSPKPLDNED
jgi:hypothetical protein